MLSIRSLACFELNAFPTIAPVTPNNEPPIKVPTPQPLMCVAPLTLTS